MIRQHPILSVATLLYLGAVAWITLGPQPLDRHNASWLYAALRLFSRHEATAWITYPLVELTANVLMFVPIGAFLLLILGRRRWWLAVLFGVLLTIAIEVTQRFLPGRVSDIRDILANSAGTLIGVLAVLVITWPATRRRIQAAPAAG